MSNTGGRYPGSGVMAYGAPPADYHSPPMQPYELTPNVQAIADIPIPPWAQAKRKLRVSVRREDDGEMKIKIMVDGEVVAEGISNGTTLTIEKDV